MRRAVASAGSHSPSLAEQFGIELIHKADELGALKSAAVTGDMTLEHGLPRVLGHVPASRRCLLFEGLGTDAAQVHMSQAGRPRTLAS